MTTVLVTGASGFLGQAVTRRMGDEGWDVLALSRRPSVPSFNSRVVRKRVGDITESKEWASLLEGVDCVVHLAARVHVLQEKSQEPWTLYRAVNVDATLCLAQAALTAGVKRFVFISSVGVNGTRTDGAPFTEADRPNPGDDYARSKWMAECELREIAVASGLEVVILRPPLIYGPQAPGNFARLVEWVLKEYPLPLASVRNTRSFVFRENLADAILRCVVRPEACNQTFLVSDGEDLSTPDLIRRMARAAGLRARLWNCPPSLLHGVGSLLGREREMRSLLDSLQIDSSRIRQQLGWRPPYSMEEGMVHSMQAYLSKRGSVEAS